MSEWFVNTTRTAQNKFSFRTANLYEDAIRSTRDLVAQYSNEGIAHAGRYTQKVADIVLERFQAIEGILREIYIDPFADHSFNESERKELSLIVTAAYERELDRAIGMADNLCSSFVGANPERYASAIAALRYTATVSRARLDEAAMSVGRFEAALPSKQSTAPVNTQPDDVDATAMIDALIDEGRVFFQKITDLLERVGAQRKPQEQVTVAELKAWYTGMTELFELRFGAESPEYKVWAAGLEQIRLFGFENVGRFNPPGGHWELHNLGEALGLLTKIRLLQFRKRKTDSTSEELSGLHPKIAKRCRALFSAREYDSAVLAAFTAVEEQVRARSKAPATDVGVNLIASAMNPKSPALKFSDIPAEQEGYMALFRGSIGAIKNPLSHRTVGHSDPVRVTELLGLASFLMKLIDDLP